MRFIDPDGCQIILGGPALNIGIGKFSATLLNISDLQDGYILGSALVSSITGRAPTSFEITTNEYGVFNGVVFQPVSSDDIEVAKSGLLLPAVSGATVNKIGNKFEIIFLTIFFFKRIYFIKKWNYICNIRIPSDIVVKKRNGFVGVFFEVLDAF